MESLSDKLKSKAKILDSDHIRGFKQQLRTTWNPNHRHDEEHEKEIDRQLQAIRDSHRFNSFAPETSGSIVRSHVDGHDFFWAVSIMLEEAKESIMILDWCMPFVLVHRLTPELYLRRPPAQHPEYRLDKLLHRKAKEGVKIYIIVYKEVTQTMSMSSSHTKHALEELHENIKVMRHPDHLNGEIVLFWSHHEKMTIVDSTRATIGGLDLCFGRWDLHDHPLSDVHVTKFADTLFPGQDYNNARVLDFQAVDDYASNAVDMTSVARMPWHDTSMTIMGPAVIDLCQHFAERWNFVKHLKYKHKDGYDWLALPSPYEADIDACDKTLEERRSDPEAGLDEARRSERRREHPHLAEWMDRGRQFYHPYHFHPSTEPRAEEQIPRGSCRVQVVRSAGDWSHGVLVEDSIQRAYAQLIMEANHFIYIENQFFITETSAGQTPVVNTVGQALVDRIVSAARSGTKFKVIIMIPEMPAFPGDLSAQGGLKAIMGAQYRSINRGGHSIIEMIEKEGIDPTEYIRWYNLRCYDRINAPKSYLEKMEKDSGVSYFEAQIALAKIWVGSDDIGDKQTDEVNIKIPMDESGEVDQLESADTGKTVQGVKMPKTVEEAQAVIDRFEKAAPYNDDQVEDNVGQHALNSKDGLLSTSWTGTQEEELEAYITELCYIHSKIMIVDDRRVICGSANLNDRSMCGDRDSEIALVVEDMDTVEMTMDGKKYEGARFAKQWRHQLMKEHLGLIVPQGHHTEGEKPTREMMPAPHPHTDFLGTDEDQLIQDPLSDDFLKLWTGTAKKNREIFTKVFRTLPHDEVKNWDQYNKYAPSGKTGHLSDPNMPIEEVKQRLSEVKGHLVEMPIGFLIEEKQLVTLSNLGEVNSITLPIYL
ncbi:Phospholipase D1 [Phaffia rhodozyma]|uniref:Phospholipase n=1 Tax=Phaffia rhodozyma TaxID=264483 RepID=A0A0F7SL85_PHARH|nr:Phospholipase D1 [Phaffia rhodozyma]